jgi:uncharacterized membrane protein
MESRTVILGLALVVILLGGAATIADLVRNGPTALAAASLLVLALLASGVVGALRHPEDR